MTICTIDNVYLEANRRFHVFFITSDGDTVQTELLAPLKEDPENPGTFIPDISLKDWTVFHNGVELGAQDMAVSAYNDAGIWKIQVQRLNETFKTNDYVVVWGRTKIYDNDIQFTAGQKLTAQKLNNAFQKIMERLEELKAAGFSFASSSVFSSVLVATQHTLSGFTSAAKVEINDYINTVSKPDLDTYTQAKKDELAAYTNTKQTELSAQAQYWLAAINSAGQKMMIIPIYDTLPDTGTNQQVIAVRSADDPNTIQLYIYDNNTWRLLSGGGGGGSGTTVGSIGYIPVGGETPIALDVVFPEGYTIFSPPTFPRTGPTLDQNHIVYYLASMVHPIRIYAYNTRTGENYVAYTITITEFSDLTITQINLLAVWSNKFLLYVGIGSDHYLIVYNATDDTYTISVHNTTMDYQRRAAVFSSGLVFTVPKYADGQGYVVNLSTGQATAWTTGNRINCAGAPVPEEEAVYIVENTSSNTYWKLRPDGTITQYVTGTYPSHTSSWFHIPGWVPGTQSIAFVYGNRATVYIIDYVYGTLTVKAPGSLLFEDNNRCFPGVDGNFYCMTDDKAAIHRFPPTLDSRTTIYEASYVPYLDQAAMWVSGELWVRCSNNGYKFFVYQPPIYDEYATKLDGIRFRQN